MKFFYIPLFFLFALTSLQAQQNKEVTSAVAKVMQEVRAKTYNAVNEEVLYKPANAGQVVEALVPYLSDTLQEVRSKAYQVLALAGQKTKEEQVREKIVGLLLQGAQDKEAGVRSDCIERLANFKPQDFNSASRQKLGALLQPETSYLDKIALLTGYVGDKAYEQPLQDLLRKTNLGRKERWSVQMALARMGNTTAIDQVVGRLKGVRVNDDMIYEAAPMLVYLRQQQSIDYLFEIVMSDAKNCESANPDSEVPILCAYRVMEYLAPVVKDFPLKVTAGGDLDVKDYEKALVTVRKWYAAHKATYQVVKDVY
jgi:HEAT repeat protein